jgi:hypothetical protein
MTITEAQKFARQNNAKKAGLVKLEKKKQEKELDKYIIYSSSDEDSEDD